MAPYHTAVKAAPTDVLRAAKDVEDQKMDYHRQEYLKTMTRVQQERPSGKESHDLAAMAGEQDALRGDARGRSNMINYELAGRSKAASTQPWVQKRKLAE